MKILIRGLPGSGKTSLAEKLSKSLHYTHINADKIRELYNDWDFSQEGRTRQAHRMILLSKQYDNCIVDFVCPYVEHSKHFDCVIFMDTIKKGRYKDTNDVFQKGEANIIIYDFDYDIDNLMIILTLKINK